MALLTLLVGEASAKRFNWYLSTIFIFWMLAFVFNVYQYIALFDDAQRKAAWRGFVYLGALMLPLGFAFWMSSKISGEMEEIEERISDAHIVSDAAKKIEATQSSSIKRRRAGAVLADDQVGGLSTAASSAGLATATFVRRLDEKESTQLVLSLEEMSRTREIEFIRTSGLSVNNLLSLQT